MPRYTKPGTENLDVMHNRVSGTRPVIHYCVAGIDDGYFERDWSRTLMALAIHCWHGGRLCPCRLLLDTVTVDGLDATDVAERLVRRALSEKLEIEALLTDTVVFAGFNILDPIELHYRLGLPVIVVYWYPSHREAVERALQLHFSDWKRRLGVMEEVWNRLRYVRCRRGGLLVAVYGADYAYAWSLVCNLQLFTRHPEPLFTAHRTASMLSRALGPFKDN